MQIRRSVVFTLWTIASLEKFCMNVLSFCPLPSVEYYKCHEISRLHRQRRNLYGLHSFSKNKSNIRSSTAMRSLDVPLESDGVLGLKDLTDGTVLALVLAFSYSFLQRDSSNVILWKKSDTNDGYKELEEGNSIQNDLVDSDEETSSKRKTFTEDGWRDLIRSEDYIFFNKRKDSNSDQSIAKNKTENKAVLIALLILFVPLFSIEFFFALSRQFICGGDPFTQSELSQFLCSEHV